LKILHINFSDNKGGASRAAIRLHKALLNNSTDSNFFCLFSKIKNKKLKIISPNYYKLQINLIKYYLGKMLGKFFNTSKISIFSFSIFSSDTINFINKSDFDLIHLHWVCGETISIKEIGKINKPIVWTLHDMWPLTGGEHCSLDDHWYNKNFVSKKLFDFRKLLLNLKKKHWRKKFFFISPSHWMNSNLKKSFLKKNNSKIIPNTLDVNFWKLKKKNIKVNTIGYVLTEKNSLLKGTDLAYQIFDRLDLVKNSTYKIKILGKFPRKLNKYKNLKIENFVSENDIQVRNFYNSIDCLLVTSRQESFCQIASEANSCGKPVISFEIGGLKDIIINDINGYKVKNFNIQKITNRIIDFFYLDMEKRKRMSKKCMELSLKRYSYEVIAEQHLKIYEKILKK